MTKPERIFSKRAAQIADELARTGYRSHKARRIAALRTRAPKQRIGVDELMPRWQAELKAAGLSPEGLRASIDAAARGASTPAPLNDAEINQLVAEVFAPDGPLLTRHPTFTRRHLMAEVAPHLYGHDPAELAPIVERLLSVSGVSALPRTPGAREQAYRFTGC